MCVLALAWVRKLQDRPVFDYVFEEKDMLNPERQLKKRRESQADVEAVGQATAAAKATDTSTFPKWTAVPGANGRTGAAVDIDSDCNESQQQDLHATHGARKASDQKPPQSIAAVKLKDLQSELVCSICQDWIVHAASIECGHMFCRECINQWLTHKHFLCPVCRAAVRQGPTAARALDAVVDKTIQQSSKSDKQEFALRVKKADQSQTKRQTDKRELEESVKQAVRSKKKFFHVNQNWGKKGKKLFQDGVKQYICEAREAYCKLVGLTVSWVYSADDSKLNQALHNLGLQEFVSKEEQEIRQRLLMFLHYG